jgi:hypothetical protein
MKQLFLDWIVVDHNFGYWTQSELNLGACTLGNLHKKVILLPLSSKAMYLINYRLNYSFWIFLNVRIRIKLSINFETTLLISIVTSYGDPQMKVSFQNIQVGAITIQWAKKRRRTAKKNNQNWINIYVFHLKQSWQVIDFSFIWTSRNSNQKSIWWNS